MKILRNDESRVLRWRRLVIAHDATQLRECAVLDRAQIPHVVGLHFRYKTPTGRPREGEQWIMVPFQHYSAACSLLFSTPEKPRPHPLS
jgi:hypothetical protein